MVVVIDKLSMTAARILFGIDSGHKMLGSEAWQCLGSCSVLCTNHGTGKFQGSAFIVSRDGTDFGGLGVGCSVAWSLR